MFDCAFEWPCTNASFARQKIIHNKFSAKKKIVHDKVSVYNVHAKVLYNL